jgi:hypothetical protein
MRNIVSVICSILLLLPYTNAFSKKDAWITGSVDCGVFLAGCDINKLHINCQAQAFWTQGFISGRTDESNTFRRKISLDSMKYALIKYCRENPLNNTYEAARSIYKELIK